MNYFKRNNKSIWFWGFIILLIMNLSIIGTVIYYSSKIKDEKQTYYKYKFRDNGPKSFIMNRLNFDESQKAEFSKVLDNHQKKVRSLKLNLRKSNRDLVKEVASEDPSKIKIKRLKSDILDNHNDIIEETIDFYKQTKEICNPSQLQNLNIMFEEIMMRPPPGEGPHHRIHKRKYRKFR